MFTCEIDVHIVARRTQEYHEWHLSHTIQLTKSSPWSSVSPHSLQTSSLIIRLHVLLPFLLHNFFFFFSLSNRRSSFSVSSIFFSSVSCFNSARKSKFKHFPPGSNFKTLFRSRSLLFGAGCRYLPNMPSRRKPWRT